MQRYFVDTTYAAAQEAGLRLSGEDYHHSIHVMRMTVGGQCYLAFLDQVVIIAEITSISDDFVSLKEISIETQDKELPIEVTIASGFPKGDKYELIVQKATELGAYHFIGFPGKTSVVKWDQKKLNKKNERLTKIAKEAAEQSHRQHQPTITLVSQFNELVSQLAEYDQVLVAYEEAAKSGEAAQLVQTLTAMEPGQKLLVIFGPEGGLTPAEVETFENLGGKRCGLGPRILRTETAPFYVLSAISYHYELLN